MGWAMAFSPMADSMRSGVITSVTNRRPWRPSWSNGEMLLGPPETKGLSGGAEYAGSISSFLDAIAATTPP